MRAGVGHESLDPLPSRRFLLDLHDREAPDPQRRTQFQLRRVVDDGLCRHDALAIARRAACLRVELDSRLPDGTGRDVADQRVFPIVLNPRQKANWLVCLPIQNGSLREGQDGCGSIEARFPRRALFFGGDPLRSFLVRSSRRAA